MLLGWTVSVSFAAPPAFENATPAGFSVQDSTTQIDFIEGQAVTVRVDLNQAATPNYPAIGHFHNLETSKQVESEDVDGLRTDVALSGDSIVHMAWIAQEVVSPVTTPVYFVRYARSNDNGATFSTPISVSGTQRFDILTAVGTGTSFSTLDLEVDSRGNPRIAYAFDHSPDGNTVAFSSNPDNTYFNYSENGGASWLPANQGVVVNDLTTVGNSEGQTTAFPRLAIDLRDNIYISYVRGSSRGAGNDDIMLAKVDRQTRPFTMEDVGSLGTANSSGGVRISPDGTRQTGPDMAVGSGEVLHLVYFNDGANDIEHKTLLGDDWNVVSSSGWNQNVDGADVDDFDNSTANAALETPALFYFPTVVVDQQDTPDKIYSIYKFGDATFETVAFNSYTYDNGIGANAGWNTAQAAPVWSTATSPIFADGNQNYNVELEWTVTERVSAVVDDRRPDTGDLHIAFSAGYSSGGEQDIYYGYYNGISWTLPEKVADDDSDGTGTADGIATTDVFLGSPVLAKRSADANIYMAFSGATGEGLGVDDVTDVNHHAYFKVLGRAFSSNDVSVPTGGFQYNLSYTPVNPHNVASEEADQVVYVHVADNANGTGLGATGQSSDGFLAGDWESVGSSLGDDDKNFEGKVNEDAGSTNEWGDDDDKIGLLAKLNVLGSDSSTNLQIITNSTASAAGTGLGARTVRVGTDPTGSFVVAGTFFLFGADIDIIDANTAPVVNVSSPDGVGDTASVAFPIEYDLTDVDDDVSTGNLKISLYFAADSTLSSVQDIRIFGTLIADENDNSTVFASGTDDFAEGTNQIYTWDDPSAALQAKLFASIHKAPSGPAYIYLVADDQKNPPVFGRSPGALQIKHKPIIDLVDPARIDTVDTGVRSGAKANPYDLDFRVRDFDRQGSTQVRLFYAAASGITSVSVSGTFPNLSFALGKSLAGTRGTTVFGDSALTSTDTELSWDVSTPLVSEGAYFLYAVASDSTDIVVGQSAAQLVVKHSPAFTFFEPAADTHRSIGTGSQPTFTIQWQKGPGDVDADDNANIDLYFTTDNPATINYEDFPDSLFKDADTRVLVKGLTEDSDGKNDMYLWNFRDPPNEMPVDGQQSWLYAISSDAKGNQTLSLGGSLSLNHEPHITLISSHLSDLASFSQGDVLRLEWDDYLIDHGSSTDDAHIRLYAALNPSAYTTLQALDASIDGTNTLLLNSSNGNTTGTIQSIREDSVDFFDWNTRLFGAAATYDVYAAIGKDATFSNNVATSLSKSSSALVIGGAVPSTDHFSLSPTDRSVAVGDTVTFDVMVFYPNPINFVQVVLKLGDSSFSVVDQGTGAGPQPFLDLNNVFAGASAIEDTFLSSSSQLRFAKSSFVGEVVGSSTQPVALARVQLVAGSGLQATPLVEFSTGETGTVFGLPGKSDPLDSSEALGLVDPNLNRVSRGQITATVELEGRTAPLGDNDHSTLLDVHLRLPGSTIDISDTIFRTANDDHVSTVDTVEVNTNAAGALTLLSVPAGRYVLTLKDTSHISGRTDTITIRNGETLNINATSSGFFGSDLRGDPTVLLPSTGAQLIAGDATEDNEINEDDVNLIIAAWGSAASATGFHQADINNDDLKLW